MAKTKEKEQNTEGDAEQAASSTSNVQRLALPETNQHRTQLLIDDSKADVHYASNAHIHGSAEEIVLDFSRRPRPGRRPDTAILNVDSKIIMNPWAAKRLAIELWQTVQHYEEMYGVLEVDARKRAKAKKALTKI